MTQIPRHYAVAKTDGDYKYWLISEQPFSFGGVSSWIPPAFGSGSHLYFGAFQGVALTDAADAEIGSCVLDTSAYSTNVYPNPCTNRNIVQFRAQCKHDVFSQLNLGQYDVVYMLALIEYKTFKLQEILEGNTEYASWDYAKATAAGATVNLGNFSGSIYSETESKYIANSYRGIENIFGNVYQFADGANINADDNQRLWMCYDPDNYASDVVTNYIDTECASTIDDTDDYIKDVYGTGKHCSLFPIDNTDASSATFISDYLYMAALGVGWRVLMVGGALHEGRRAGFGYRDSTCDSSGNFAGLGVRLAAVYV
jgi:hypothetical protein